MVHSPVVTARLALLVAPSDPLVSSAPARLEALGWLRNQLSRRGFQIAIAGGAGDVLADLERIAAGVSPGDVVLVHVSGRLVETDSIALARANRLRLSAVTDLLAARTPGYVSLILDLVRSEGEPAPDLLETLGGRLVESRASSLLAAVRAPAADPSERIAFTRLAMPPFDDGGPPSTEALLAAMYDQALASDLPVSDPQGLLFVQGLPDPTIDGLVAQATAALDWPRVVELRLDRAETLAAAAQRAQELTGIARILRVELGDADGAVEALEQARALDPKRASVLEALRDAYEAAGRAAPINPAEYATAFAAHRRAGQADAALLDAMLLDELGAAQPEHQALVEQARTSGPVQVRKPLDAAAWEALRAPGFDDALAALLSDVHDAAIAARLAGRRASRRPPPLESSARLDPESTVSAVRTLHWAARVLGVTCPDLHAGADDGGDAVTHVPGERPSISLAPRVLSGTPTKQLAFLAGRALTWYRPEYHGMLYYPALEDLRELLGARLGELGGDVGLERWIRSAELTAARTGLLLCGELKIAVSGARSQVSAPGRPSGERVASDLVSFCASRAHGALRAEYLRLDS